MKIMHMLYSDRYSGAENVVCQIIDMFRHDENMEMVYCSRDGQIRETLAERDITFVPIAEFTVKELKRILKEQQPDVIHAHDMRASFVAARACGNTPIISHIHNNNFDSRGLSLKSIAYLFAGIKAKHIFWVSRSAFEGYAFHGFLKHKSEILYNVIDISALYEKMNADLCIYDYDVVYLGRLTFEKNPQRLMRVLQKVAEKMPLVKIAVIGTGEMAEETIALAEELRLQKNIQFLGFQSNPFKMLHDAKVMVMTSRWEGTPMCALESMALGVPIVSTPTDGLRDLVRDGENGFLSDADEKLADNIINIIQDTNLQDSLSKAAKKDALILNDIGKYKSCLKRIYMEFIAEGSLT